MFCILLDQKFVYAEDYDGRMHAIADVIALSELYGIREANGTRIDIDVLAWDGSSKDMSDNSAFYMGLSQLLRSNTLFSRSLGYLLAHQCTHSYSHDCYEGIILETDLLHTTHRDLKLLVLEKRDDILPIVTGVLTKLQELTLYPEKHINRKGELCALIRRTF